ncbi:MAG: hypothetical protein J7L99_03040 [Planctomycetes bacterium]|nr:hypothetical protein [Planctomycetota bacterium]
MKTLNDFVGKVILLLFMSISLQSLMISHVRGQQREILIEGFEASGALQTSGKVEVVKGADVATEGTHALKMEPDSRVRISIPPKAIKSVGWLKIDTFGVHPVIAWLEINLSGSPGKTKPSHPFRKVGYIKPGKDTLALPLGLVAKEYTGPWPDRPYRLELRNTSHEPIVIDNVRLAPPLAPPKGVVLLDFGPSNQAVWPGFEPAGTMGKGITWSGNHRIYCYSSGYPDPLQGDIAGRALGYKQRENAFIQSQADKAIAWIWMTHYSYGFSPAVEYEAKVNNRVMLRGKLSPAQMLSNQGLLLGKDQPWTADWLEKSFIPKIVSTVEVNLKKGNNALELMNCQIAAMIISPAKHKRATLNYIRNIKQDLSRYYRQFVLADQSRPHCDLSPNEDETKSGFIVLSPPRNEWFSRTYKPAPEHRTKQIDAIAASGSAATIAFAVVPCKKARLIRAYINNLVAPSKGIIPRGNIKIYSLNTMPVVRDGLVYYQPYILGQDFRDVPAGEICWFALRIIVPQRTRTGDYRGKINISTVTRSAQLSVNLRVVHLEGEKGRKGITERVVGLISTGNCREVYHSLSYLIPQMQRYRIRQNILTYLVNAGINAPALAGPALEWRKLKIIRSSLFDGLQVYPRLKNPGKTLIRLDYAFEVLEGREISAGTSRYRNIAWDLVKASQELVHRGRIKDYALYCGNPYRRERIQRIISRVEAVHRANGKAAMGIYASYINSMSAAERTKLFASLDTLLCLPNHRSIATIASRFKKGHANKTFAVLLSYPDVYSAGFYSWAIGADGVYLERIFAYYPLFNAFRFSPMSLLLPDQSGRFMPTLSLLNLQRAIDDYDLARRCEHLVNIAKQHNIDTTELQKILDEIRIITGKTVPGFVADKLRSDAVLPSQLEKWRESMIKAAGEISKKLSK